MAGQTVGQLKSDKRSKTKKQADFLTHLSVFASVSKAAKKAKVPRSNIYEWLKKDIDFINKYEEACKEALGALEDEAIRRAHEGFLKPVYQGGRKVGTIREFSDTMLIVLLKARAPEKYKERFAGEISGKNGGAIETKSEIVVTLKAQEIKEISSALEDEV